MNRGLRIFKFIFIYRTYSGSIADKNVFDLESFCLAKVRKTRPPTFGIEISFRYLMVPVQPKIGSGFCQKTLN